MHQNLCFPQKSGFCEDILGDAIDDRWPHFTTKKLLDDVARRMPARKVAVLLLMGD